MSMSPKDFAIAGLVLALGWVAIGLMGFALGQAISQAPVVDAREVADGR